MDGFLGHAVEAEAAGDAVELALLEQLTQLDRGGLALRAAAAAADGHARVATLLVGIDGIAPAPSHRHNLSVVLGRLAQLLSHKAADGIDGGAPERHRQQRRDGGDEAVRGRARRQQRLLALTRADARRHAVRREDDATASDSSCR